MTLILGLDIGGANTKYALIDTTGNLKTAGSDYFPFWREMENFSEYVLKLKNKLELKFGSINYVVFVTTAELADCFTTKEEGISKICSFLDEAFQDNLEMPVQIYSINNEFISTKEAHNFWLEVSASNWFASASFLAKKYPDSLMIDIGSTTTDFIPIHNGAVEVEGKNDLERLISGELVYLGILRTNVVRILHEVKLGGKIVPISSELFATTGDVYLILDLISEEDFNVKTADGKAATKENAKNRLLRIVCADRNQLDEKEIRQIALQIKEKHYEILSKAFNKILDDYREKYKINPICLLMGSGGKTFGLALLRENGIFEEILVEDELSEQVSIAFPAYATAQLFLTDIIKNKEK